MSCSDAVLVVVRSEPGVWSLEDVLLSDRDAPVIVLTQSQDTLEPVLAPEKVRAVAGEAAAIYYMPGDYLLEQLRRTLGSALAVSRGAVRTFWPGLSTRSDPADHPLVPILEGELEVDALAEFARQFDLSRPAVRQEIRLIEDARSVLQSELDAADNELRTTAEQLRDANIARHEALTRAEQAEDSLGSDGRLSARSLEEALHVLITREWLRAFLPADRHRHPLGGYVLTPQLLGVVAVETGFAKHRIAWVCAMVASGYASFLAGLAPERLLTGPGGPQLERADGALGWRCTMKRDMQGCSWLHYWTRPDQTVEFTDVEHGDAPETP
jgi:hypothetical protein